MKYKKLRFAVLLLLGMEFSFLEAQQSMPAAGGNAEGNGGTVAYTAGQITYTTQTGSNITITQGVQQPYEILVVTSVKQSGGIILVCDVYPNPTSDNVILKVEYFELSSLSFQLFDQSGKILLNKKAENNETTIQMEGFIPATYFLKINRNNKEIKTFKIIKN